MINPAKPMIGKICLITGATSGIGLKTAEALAKMGATTIIVGRNKDKCLKIVNKIKDISNNPDVNYFTADLSSLEKIQHLAQAVKKHYYHLDILINNVGAKFVKRQESVDGYEMTFALNHLGPFLLTHLLLEVLKKSTGGRIINVSSGAHTGCPQIDFNDLQSRHGYVGKKAYALSKLANISFTYELARRLKVTSITANSLHPGGVATNFCKNNGLFSWGKHLLAHLLARNLVCPVEGARTSIYLASSPEVNGANGKYFINLKPASSSSISYDPQTAQHLWQVSLKLTGLASS